MESKKRAREDNKDEKCEESPAKRLKTSRGRVFLGSKRRGVEQPVRLGCVRIDVTSGSGKKLGEHKATTLSPLYLPGPPVKKGARAITFENDWQFRKAYPQLKHVDAKTNKPTPTYWKWRTEGFQKLKKDKGIRTPTQVSAFRSKQRKAGLSDECKPAYSLTDDGRQLDYVAARKELYAPVYAQLIKDLPFVAEMQKLLDAGKDLLLIDLDGPDLEEYPSGQLIDEDVLRSAINDTRKGRKFGHGYVVAAVLLGLSGYYRDAPMGG